MNRFLIATTLGVLLVSVAGAAAGTPAARAATVTDVSGFYDALAPYGEWTRLPGTGWVWHPGGVDREWRPYTDGRWVWTDEHGWYWVSDLEWGRIPFHYGRWLHTGDDGWVWVPGTEWSPAWVVWRYGPGYVGWAPLPPDAVYAGAGLPGPEDYYTVASRERFWVFVEAGSFLAPHIRRVAAPAGRNTVIVRRTGIVTRRATAARGARAVVSRELPRGHVQRATRRPDPSVRITPPQERQRDHDRERFQGNGIAGRHVNAPARDRATPRAQRESVELSTRQPRAAGHTAATAPKPRPPPTRRSGSGARRVAPGLRRDEGRDSRPLASAARAPRTTAARSAGSDGPGPRVARAHRAGTPDEDRKIARSPRVAAPARFTAPGPRSGVRRDDPRRRMVDR